MKIAQMIVRVCGVLLILLGIAFWIGRGLRYVNVHMLLGIILVLALWYMGIRALTLGMNAGLAITALIWGLIVIGFGSSQQSIMPGSLHWIIQVIHLLLGLVAIGLAEMLGRASARRAPAPA